MHLDKWKRAKCCVRRNLLMNPHVFSGERKGKSSQENLLFATSSEKLFRWQGFLCLSAWWNFAMRFCLLLILIGCSAFQAFFRTCFWEWIWLVWYLKVSPPNRIRLSSVYILAWITTIYESSWFPIWYSKEFCNCWKRYVVDSKCRG